MVKILRPRQEFNTRRSYGYQGQVIQWCYLSNDEMKYPSPTTWVVFRDITRGIDGAIPVWFGNDYLLTDEWVLRAYDGFIFRHPSFEELEALKGVQS